MSHPLWLFWSGDHLTFLRWMTIKSAAIVHDEVVLVRRRVDSSLRDSELEASRTWHEHQDFQRVIPAGRNWIDDIPPQVRQVWLEDVAREIADLRAPDVQTSDLLGWWLLAEYGGSVADMDVVFLKPPPAIDHDVKVVRCSGSPKVGYMPIGFLQGRPCKFWREMYRRALERYNPAIYESCGAGLFPPYHAIQGDKGLLSEAIVYPFALRADWMAWHPWMFEADSWPTIPEECIGVHWYGGMNQEHNWALTHENLPSAKGAIPWAIRHILGEVGESLGR